MLSVASQPPRGATYSAVSRNPVTVNPIGIQCSADAPPSNDFPSELFTTDPASPNPLTDTDYFEFTVDAEVLGSWLLSFETSDELSLSALQTNGGPAMVAAFYSTNGGVSFTQLGSDQAVPTGSSSTLSFAFPSPVAAASSIIIRVFGFDALLVGGELVVDDLQLTGTVTSAVIPPIYISEIMQNPDDVPDANGEWFEVFNGGSSNVDLLGYTIQDDGSDDHIITSSVIVPAGGFAVLCKNSNTVANGDFSCDYEYGNDITLANGDDEVVLVLPGGTVEVDRVAYDGGPNFPDPTGASMVYFASTADDNNNGSNWATSVVREPTYNLTNGNTDDGSPGTAGGGTQLPVELVAFEAVADGEAIMLRWETASETNNAGFEIQQRTFGSASKDETWQAVRFVEGYGTTEQAQSYEHHIDYVQPGIHRFRLKQIDYDGTFEYSPEVEVAIGVPGTYRLTAAYPNPFNPETSFSLSVARTQEVQVVVYDVVGRRVALLYDGLFPAETSRSFRFEADTLPSGVYLLRVLGEQFVTTQSLVLTK